MNPYCKLAKKAVEKYVKEGEKITPPSDLPEKLVNQKGGVFVTLKKEGKLRGCIGTIAPTKENIAQEIIANAIAAATQDPRFPSVSKEELDQLSYTVSILGKPKPIKGIEELNPEKYGIIVQAYPKGITKEKLQNRPPAKQGLLLPNLEGIDTARQQLDAVCRKAGINPAKEAIALFRFEAEKHEQ